MKSMKIDKLTGEVDKANPFGATIKTEEELIKAVTEKYKQYLK